LKIPYTLKQVISLHDKIIEETGGLKGILNIGLLEEALYKPFMGLADGVELYPGVARKAAVLFEALVSYHPFADGNKRTAEIVTAIFLWHEGYLWDFDEDEIVEFATDVAQNKLSIDNIKNWIEIRLNPKNRSSK
jgi:death-on-curing protein